METGFQIGSQEGIYSEPEELNILSELRQALDKGEAELLLSEIVILELERIKKEKELELEKIYADAINSVKNVISSGKKFSDVAVNKIQTHLNVLCDDEKKKNDEVWYNLELIFEHKNTKVLPLNEQILLAAYKRGIMGKKPFVQGYAGRDSAFKKNALPSHNIQPDCIIIENLASFLKTQNNFYLYLATNDSGFYTSLDKKEIDAEIKKELNIKYFSQTLSELLNKAIGLKGVKKQKTVKEEQNAFPLIEKNITEEGKVIENSDIVKG